MSKSIYEEAFEKIDVGFGGWDRAYRLEFVKSALKQAQKQERLLKLYREKDKYTRAISPLPNVELNRYRNIVKQINELEKEIRKENKDDL